MQAARLVYHVVVAVVAAARLPPLCARARSGAGGGVRLFAICVPAGGTRLELAEDSIVSNAICGLMHFNSLMQL